jgi:hypothetical protein
MSYVPAAVGQAGLKCLVVDDISGWFDEYLAAFAACGRGQQGAASLLAYYGVPLLLTTDGGFFALTNGDQIVSAVQPQLDGMRAAGYASSEVLGSAITLMNATSALYRGNFAYRRNDGSEIRRVSLTYLVTDGSAGLRISALLVNPVPHRIG